MAGKTGKNDAADAIAICEAVQRPHMRFVPVKDESQQAMQCLHRTRQGFIQERTATYNRLRGLVSEFGIIAPKALMLYVILFLTRGNSASTGQALH